MAETERLGGISVDVGVNDGDVDAALTRLEGRLQKIVERNYNIELKLTGGEADSARPKKPIKVDAELVFKVGTTRAMVAEQFAQKPVQIPATLKISPAEISRLKAFILEQFKGFEIPITLKAGEIHGGHMTARVGQTHGRPEVQDADAGGQLFETRRIVRQRAVPTNPYSRDTASEKMVEAVNAMRGVVAQLKQQDVPQGILRQAEAKLRRQERIQRAVRDNDESVIAAQYPSLYNAVTEPHVVATGKHYRRTPLRRPGDPLPERQPRPTRPVPTTPTPPPPPPRPPATAAEEARALREYEEEDPEGLAAWRAKYGAQYKEHLRSVDPAPRRTPNVPRTAPALRRIRTRQGPTLSGAAAEAAEREDARRRRQASLGGMMSRAIPEVSEERLFDETPLGSMPGDEPWGARTSEEVMTSDDRLRVRGDLVLRGPSRRGPRRKFGRPLGPRSPRTGGDQRRGLAWNPPPNQVTRGPADPRGRYPMDPRLANIVHRLEQGEFGTPEEPYFEKLDAEGQVRYDANNRPMLRRASEGLIERAKAQGVPLRSDKPFRDRGGYVRFVSPATMAKREINKLGIEVGTLDAQKLYGTGVETDPEGVRRGVLATTKPRIPQDGMGGYRGVSEGGLPVAVRSAHDTPEGNAANQARIEASRYRAAYRSLDSETRATVRALKDDDKRRAFLKPFLPEMQGKGGWENRTMNTAEEKRLRRDDPEQYGEAPEIDEFFKKYASRNLDTDDIRPEFMPQIGGEAVPLTPQNLFNARVRQFQRDYNVRTARMSPDKSPANKGPALPQAMQTQLASMRSAIKATEATIREAGDRVSSTERITPSSRPRNRTFTPAEEQLADLRTMLFKLEGDPGSLSAVGGTHHLGVSSVRMQGVATRTNPRNRKYPQTRETLVDEWGLTSTGSAPGRAGTAEEQRRAANMGGATSVKPRRMGEVEASQYLLWEVEARGARDTKAADRIRSILTGQFEQSGEGAEKNMGLPAGTIPGIDITPAANIGEARRRLAAAKQKQRGARRLLQPTAAAAAAERNELLARGVDLSGMPILGDSRVLGASDFQAKVAAAAGIRSAEYGPGLDIRGMRGLASDRAMRTGYQPRNARGASTETVEPNRPVEPTVMAAYAARKEEILHPGGRQMEMFNLPLVAAEEGSPRLEVPPGGGGGGSAPTLSGGRGPVDVIVKNFSELKGYLFAKGETPTVESGKGSGKKKRATLDPNRPLTDEDRTAFMTDAQRSELAGMPRIGGANSMWEQRYQRRASEIDAEVMAARNAAPGALKAASGRAGPLPAGGRTEKEEKIRLDNLSRITRDFENTYGVPLARATPDANRGKSSARIASEAAILEARSANPTRAFQTAVAAYFAKTIGGGGGFEERVKLLTRSLDRWARASDETAKLQDKLGAAQENLRTASTEYSKGLQRWQQKFEDTGIAPDRAATLAEEEMRKSPAGRAVSAFATEEASLEKQVGRSARFEKRAQEVAEKRQANLTTPMGIVRGFGALGVGAIAGGLIYSAASQAIQATIDLLVTQGGRLADAMSGWAMTASATSAELAQAVRSSAGDIRGAIAGAVGTSGISAEGLEGLRGQGLESRAAAIAAAQNRVQVSDLFRTGSFLGGNQTPGGFDRALFEGTGGVFGGSAFAPQPGFMERIADDFQRFATPTTDVNQGGNGILGGNYIPNTGTFSESGMAPDAEQRSSENIAYVDELNRQLERANSQFRVMAGVGGELAEATEKSAQAIGQAGIGKKFTAGGNAIVGADGRALTGTQFGLASEDLARGQNMPDQRVMFEQMKRGLEAQMRGFDRDMNNALERTLPAEAALGNIASPPPRPLSGVQGVGDLETQLIKNKRATIENSQVQQDLNAYYAEGKEILENTLPPDLYKGIVDVGRTIQTLQTNISQRNAALQAAEYANQLRIARRTLGDIAGLSGKSTGVEATRLGLLQRQNVELSRQSQQLQFQLQQRQINFQMALAGFTAPGVTPEERQARIDQAKLEANLAQRQLDLQKQQFGVGIKIFDEENLRAVEDAQAAIALLQQGRQTSILNQADTEAMEKAQKLQAERVKKAGQFLSRIEKGIALQSASLTALESQSGELLADIAVDILSWFNKQLRAMTKSVQNALSGGMTGGKFPGKDEDDTYASGALFNTSGAHSMIVGEAGTETVAVLRNPRVSTGNMGGGGDIHINIHVEGGGEAGDELAAKIARTVEQTMNRKAALLGLRRPA
jgi:hypothetical protein